VCGPLPTCVRYVRLISGTVPRIHHGRLLVPYYDITGQSKCNIVYTTTSLSMIEPIKSMSELRVQEFCHRDLTVLL
jgi:hypothetical protein